jgi:radical SAM protein with 4Fe4S-binding SPASM domain
MRCPNDLKARAKSTLQFGGRLRKSRSLGVSLPVTELPDEFFQLAVAPGLGFKVGFDSCMITGLARTARAHRMSLEGCDAGRFSLFVSERMEAYPCSFMVESGYRGVSLRGGSLAEVWRSHSLFGAFRKHHVGGGCEDCSSRSECLAGCPIFPQMNLCPSSSRDPGRLRAYSEAVFAD